jgi:hypothetical protein
MSPHIEEIRECFVLKLFAVNGGTTNTGLSHNGENINLRDSQGTPLDLSHYRFAQLNFF